MSKRVPRGPVPSLIGASHGRPKRVAVKQRSRCARCHGAIPAGGDCIAIPKLGSGYSTNRRMCDDCFRKILEKTSADLRQIAALVERGVGLVMDGWRAGS